ncbi:ABC transporter ATP-binding protein [Amycolatopsis sp. NPDC098790]|uniref:ABC transporter ATP-binding protein n=1 Tax=Amycolatopsis sp. NPDC098790 TaxID=3363939 RepID=UPI0038150CAF
MTVLDITGLSARSGDTLLLDDITLSLEPGRVLVVLGASGAGKTTLGLAAVGRSHPGVELTGSTGPVARAGHLPQQPAAVLDPVRRCGPVLAELASVRHHGRAARLAAARAALADAGLEQCLWRRFPHQLSGGQQQRMALATTLVTRPRVLVLDEPTTGLDPEARSALTRRLRHLADDGTALLVLTHDLVLARAIADDIAVLHDGRVIETGSADAVLTHPVDPRTRALLTENSPAPGAPAPSTPVLTVRGLTVRAGRTALIEDVHLDLGAGTRTALVGVSGAGKTTLARAIAGLAPLAAGTIELDGVELPARIRRRTKAQLRAVQYVHQDSRASFDEFRDVLDQVADTARLLRGVTRETARTEARETLTSLGIDAADRRPGQLSGGQLQRCAMARALVAHPRVLICDEVTSALDTAARALVLDALITAISDDGTAVLMISHDHTLLSAATDRTITMTDGRITSGSDSATAAFTEKRPPAFRHW